MTTAHVDLLSGGTGSLTIDGTLRARVLPRRALIPDAAAIVSPTDDAHLLTALVQVPTDKGTFGVALVREGGNDWLAWRIVLPGMPAPTEAAR